MNVSKNGGFSSRPPGHVIPFFNGDFGRRTRRLITEILVGGGAPHNGDFGRGRGAS